MSALYAFMNIFNTVYEYIFFMLKAYFCVFEDCNKMRGYRLLFSLLINCQMF